MGPQRFLFGRRREQGLALVTTLWILAILIVVAAGFTMGVRTETKIAENFGRRVQARTLAWAGLQRAMLALQSDTTPYTARGGPWQEITSDLDPLALETGTFRVEGFDEAAKVNINVASEEQLLLLLQDEELRDALLDWRDSDDLPRTYGAESDYYLSLERPYQAKNGLLDTLEEMLLIRGVTPALFYGEPHTGTGGVSLPSGEVMPPLRDLCTIYSADTNLDAFGRTRLNIQTATKEEFQERLGDILSEEEIEAILRFRDQGSPTAEPGEEQGEAGGGGLPPGGSGAGGGFPGAGGGNLPLSPGGGSRTRQAGPGVPGQPPGLPGQPPEGPLGPGGSEAELGGEEEGEAPEGPQTGSASRFRRTGDILQVPELSRERVQEIFDFLTVTDEETIPGRINLNTADPWVLMTLPGIDETAVYDIVRYRESADGPFESVGELLQLDSITDEMFAEIADLVTVRSYNFRLRAEGRVDQGRIVQTVECVVRIVQQPLTEEGQMGGGSLGGMAEPPLRQIEVLYWRE